MSGKPDTFLGRARIAGAAACAALALVAVQVAVPGWDGLHDWPYAAALAATMALLARLGLSIQLRPSGVLGSRPVVTVVGALLIGAAGLAESLLGPDAQTVRRVPGTVAVIPDVASAAFFPVAGAPSIARGDALITLRRRTGTPLLLVSGSGAYVDGTLVSTRAAPAAYVEVRDRTGASLTLTQPTNPSFLSPVALFTQTVPLAGRNVPADSFAVPARQRTLRVFYFPAGALPGLQSRDHAREPLVLLALDDEAGHLVPHGIQAARSGQAIELGTLRITVTLGTYPEVVIASIPSPPALWLGLAALLGGLLVPGGRNPG